MTKPIRVAMVHYRDAAIAGGSLRVGETIANHLDPGQVAAEFVFAYGEPGPVARCAKVPCHFVRAKGPKDIPAWKRSRELFSKLQPDIIHFQEGVIWLRAALMGTPSRKVVHIHGRYSSFHSPEQTARQRVRTALDARLLRSYLKFTDAQICINHATRNWLLELGWISQDKSCVVYNAVDVPRFSALMPSANARAQLGLPRNALLLGMICRLVWEKGCSDFLQIVERLPERWHGVICGDGPLKDELRRECEQRGLANRIHFLGSVDDVRPVYAAIDAYAFVSRYDAFGLSVAEAKAAGVPVFGIEREGDYNESRYPLFGPDMAMMVKTVARDDIETTIERIAKRIVDYGEHPQLYRNSIDKAQSWVSECFSASLQAEAMTRVYQDISNQSRPSQAALTQLYQSKRESAERLINAFNQSEVIAATA